ncbi:hypothetical protein ONZ45_g4488 [Pleurotus djamor]|nr:hypothetical protein ONZ45_g4488 [Pleurotus djamor]
MPALLSDKAKGKQRATEQPDIENVQIPSKELVVRFTEGVPDLTLAMGPTDLVRDVKKQIREHRPQLRDRRLRLIYSGRLLLDSTPIYDCLSTIETRQKRASAGDKPTGSSPSSPTNPLPPGKLSDEETGPSHIWIHCSVGPKLEPNEEEDEGDGQSGQLQPVRGFDRLVALGFSEDDIQNFRQQFHSHSNINYLDAAEFETEEEYSEHARALEEQWIDNLSSPSTASLSSSPSSSFTSSIMLGLVVGFFFPLIPFFYMRKSRSPVVWEDGRDLHEGLGGVGSVIFSSLLLDDVPSFSRISSAHILALARCILLMLCSYLAVNLAIPSKYLEYWYLEYVP